HISDKVLDNMHRHINGENTRKLLAEMRSRVPDLKIRTTLMVGYPGEGEKEFEELLDFVKDQKFERMGAFAYSEEDDTWAAKNLGDEIPDEVKQQRLDRLMELQQEIAYQRNIEMIGQTVKVLVDRVEGDIRIGRTQWDSPEVDPEIYVDGSDAEPGEFINAKITKAEPFELFGELV
ncbi:MAG: TRAM domain-containing protein, partial [Muribaculaceae bacterium]|nr:TRAM domain-containing protein [Muribaculaceae bacterium]